MSPEQSKKVGSTDSKLEARHCGSCHTTDPGNITATKMLLY